MDPKKFGKYLREIREKSGFKTMADLARAAGVSAPTILRLEKGTTKQPDITTLKKIAKVTKTNQEVLVRNAGFLPEQGATISEGELLEGLTEEEKQDLYVYRQFLMQKRNK